MILPIPTNLMDYYFILFTHFFVLSVRILTTSSLAFDWYACWTPYRRQFDWLDFKRHIFFSAHCVLNADCVDEKKVCIKGKCSEKPKKEDTSERKSISIYCCYTYLINCEFAELIDNTRFSKNIKQKQVKQVPELITNDGKYWFLIEFLQFNLPYFYPIFRKE